MSPELKQFYVEMQEWIDAGCPSEGEKFDPDYGLCYNCIRFGGVQLQGELNLQFKDAGLSTVFPFNEDPELKDSYGDERLYGTIYENPARLAWIKKHATMED